MAPCSFCLIKQDIAPTYVVQVFVNARLHVSGGALGGGRMVEDSSSVAGLQKSLTIHIRQCRYDSLHFIDFVTD